MAVTFVTIKFEGQPSIGSTSINIIPFDYICVKHIFAVISLTTGPHSAFIRSAQRPCRMGGSAELPLPQLE